jgi:F420H(2)-dependent quinone reductase
MDVLLAAAAGRPQAPAEAITLGPAVRGLLQFPVVAEQVGDDERDAIWARFVAAYAGFEDYQAGVRRTIALIRLRRRA